MVDTHCHILFHADDGPDTVEESLEMIEIAMTQGVTHLIATSHAYKGKWHVTKEDVLDKVAALQQHVVENQWNVEILPGHEITISPHTAQQVVAEKVLPLGQSRYVLIELPSMILPAYTWDIFQELISNGYRPIIAHPERQQQLMADPTILEDYVRGGVCTQLTTGALLGVYGKTIQQNAIELVNRQLVHLLGSDAHNATDRVCDMAQAVAFLRKRDTEYVDVLLANNERILQDDMLYITEPQKPTKKRWWSRR
jgi:protein-tyrosine phosphatase